MWFFTRDTNYWEEPRVARIIITSFVFVFILWTILSWFYTVQPWQVWFEKTFGKIDWEIKTEWLYFKIPSSL